MKKLIPLMLMAVLLTTSCSEMTEGDEKLSVAVSVVPQKAFVEAVGGDRVSVAALIPPGASPANYQPTPKELMAFRDADIYFPIGVATEAANILPNIVDRDESFVMVDLAAAVDAEYPARYFEDEDEEEHEEDHEENHSHEGRDPHIWMSPKRVVVIIDAIRGALSEADPENASFYSSNAEAYIEKLQNLDASLEEAFKGSEGASFIIMHPSLGYFADDYGLNMVAIEEDGKDASAIHMQRVIDYGREHGIRFVLYQEEFDSTQAAVIAEELDGEVMAFAPLAEDYIPNMERMVETFKKVLDTK